VACSDRLDFSTTRNQDILDKAITAFQMCALISSRYKLVHASGIIGSKLSLFGFFIGILLMYYYCVIFPVSDATDNLLITLSELSTILHSNVKKFAINFGKTDRATAHYATIALFTIARKHSNNLRESWRNVCWPFSAPPL
jgi:hypothetical protein